MNRLPPDDAVPSPTTTGALERSHRALQILHDASRTLYDSDGDYCRAAVPLFQQLEALLGVGPVRFYVNDPETKTGMLAATTWTHTRPQFCRDVACRACLEFPAADRASGRPDPLAAKGCAIFPVAAGGVSLGLLEVWHPEDHDLDPLARNLLETLADQLGTAVHLQRRMNERQQLSLMHERNVIARELHDSLAQSLSYLKVQVARLRRSQDCAGTSADHSPEIVEELRTGLNDAYRHLRELLSTFRLEVDAPGLLPALQQTVHELEAHHGPAITLNCELPAELVSPNAQIHILQIVREALINAVMHAQASSIDVTVSYHTPYVRIRVVDDGVGLPGGPLPSNHYGLVIMRERAQALNGEIAIHNRLSGGVEVVLSFVPHGAGELGTGAQ